MAILKIMSFNMRTSFSNDGINNFTNRTSKIKTMLDAEAPDIIGFQEITPEMRDWLVDNLDDYYTLGAGRDKANAGEAPLIAYKKRDMQLLSCQTIMLSNTPNVFGSKYDGTDQSKCPRAYAKALLKHKDVDEPFYVYNVHTDHIGQLSRVLSSSQMLSDICSHSYEFVFTGDFNAYQNSKEIQLLTDCTQRKIIDATADLDGTFHDFGRRDVNIKIDYIFTSEGVQQVSAQIVPDTPTNGVFYSDHYAVTATIKL